MFKFLTKFFEKPGPMTAEKFESAMVAAVKTFKNGGTTATELKKGRYPAWVLKAAGYSMSELKKAGYSARALKMAGFPQDKVEKLFARD